MIDLNERITLGHGSGGKLTHELIRELILKHFKNPALAKLDDSAVLPSPRGRFAFTTDSYVVKPIFFPGGDIGKLAVCGTINDLAMSGAEPLYLSLSLIIEEGFLFSDLKKIILSIKTSARAAGVKIAGGDIKVVNQGACDRIFINTTGVGGVKAGVNISSRNARAGDEIIVSGSLGDHGIAVLASRGEFALDTRLKSDCAPLNVLVNEMLAAGGRDIHALRDLTRGGLATCLNEIAAASVVGIEIREEEIPVRPEVRAACELLGLDPLYVANEGKLVTLVKASTAGKVLRAMRKHRYGRKAGIIGRVVKLRRKPGRFLPARVVVKTAIGGRRLLDVLTGEQLPRIC